MRDVGELDAGVVERDPERGDHGLQVRARRDLGDHSPEVGVLRGARGEPLPEQDAVGDDAESGLVAGGFDSQDDRARGAGHRRSDIGLE